MPKFRRNRAPERIAVAISHSTCRGLRFNVSLILGASTPSISQTLNSNVKAIVERVSTIHRDGDQPGSGARFIGDVSSSEVPLTGRCGPESEPATLIGYQPVTE